ncbi:hypothetical protein [Synechococcus sp. UW179A]|uniref:hypothetical protein n=1 Tax=Synechococcus sp. UW179A TaxID=2575510 RepID=UPI001FCC2A8F|nr:hypothetical protein [Synechococcus sp. UW179A]
MFVATAQLVMDSSMSQARELINAHLYPVLFIFAVIYGAIQISPMANQARYFNHCVDEVIRESNVEKMSFSEKRAVAVRLCNGTSL